MVRYEENGAEKKAEGQLGLEPVATRTTVPAPYLRRQKLAQNKIEMNNQKNLLTSLACLNGYV